MLAEIEDEHGAFNGQIFARLGSMQVRLARDTAEVCQAQRLRYDVFDRQGRATPDTATLRVHRDIDAFDSLCDHLLAFDGARAVGTYRLLRQDVAERHGGFYSAGEFDIGDLLARHRSLNFLELGRSCVLPSYRDRRTIELLWRGIWHYVRQYRLDVMFGCASLDSGEPERLALSLSYLHHYARAPDRWQAAARSQAYVEMNRMAKDAIDRRTALRMLPPLIKGYLRLGATTGDGAVIDRQFGTTDVLIVLPVSAVSRRYLSHFTADPK